MPKLIDEPYKPIYWVVCGLKIIFHLTFIILWIYQAIYNPFKETFNDYNRLLVEGIIMAALFALSIISLTILISSNEQIWDLYSIMTVSLWAISALTLIQDITLIQKDINCIFFKLVKEVGSTDYFKNLLISFIIGFLNLAYDVTYVIKRKGRGGNENNIIDMIIPITFAM
ncbi:999_t:CDS:2, partial [Dentiscutata erythropus]